MNREKMIEAITTAILGKTAPQAATAVLELCGPKRLVWNLSGGHSLDHESHTVPTSYTVRYAYQNGWKWACLGRGAYGWETSPEAAQAAAQAHADAAHWGNTALGDLIGGK